MKRFRGPPSLPLKTGGSPRSRRNPSSPVLSLQVTASLSRPAPSSAASFVPLQCEGPASTRDSGCHAGRHLTGAREVDFQARSYVFSRPFHLIVSYGHLLPRRLGSGPAGASPGALHRRGAQGGQRALPLQRGLQEPWPPAPGDGVLPGGHGPGTVSGPRAPSRALGPAPGGRPADPELPDQAAPTEVGRPPPLLLLQGRPGRAGQGCVPGPSGARGLGGPLRVLLVRGRHRGRTSVETQPQAGGRLSAGAPPTLNPAPPTPWAPGPPAAKPSGPPPPPPGPPSKGAGLPSPLRAPDPHLHHQMGVLLKQMQDVRALLGHLVLELRDLSCHLKPEAGKGPAKRQ